MPSISQLTRTQTKSLRDDELYLGLRRPRARGKEYDDFVEKFVTIARKQFPRAYIHLYAMPKKNKVKKTDKSQRRLWSA